MSKLKNKMALDGKRIALSTTALDLLESEVKRIKEKGPHFKLNESKLASAIIELFISKYLNKEHEQMEAKFFDRKAYLKTLIESSSSDDELSKSLGEFFNKSKIKKVKVTHEE